MPQRRIAFAVLLACSASLSAQTAAVRVTGAPPPTVQAALAALSSGHNSQALADFQQLLASDPSSPAVNLYAATAALELYNGPLAVQYAEKARQLDPHDWKVDTTLVAAYAAAGDQTKRDALRAQLRRLHNTAGAADVDARDARGFLLEMFPVEYHPPAGPAETYHVDAIEYFRPVGEFRTYYRFLIRRPAGPRLWEIDIQSNGFDEASWARAHRAEAASGMRQFQTNGHGNAGQEVDYRMITGKDDYDAFRARVVQILSTQPLPATH